MTTLREFVRSRFLLPSFATSMVGVLICFAVLASVDQGIAAYNAGDYPTALREFSDAAKAGDPAGKHLLGSLYYQGHGVERDVKKAAALFFAEATAANYRPSLANLSIMYAVGDGVPKDAKLAFEFGRRAAELGDLQSQFNMGQAYRKGAGVAQDYAQAAHWYRKAAEAGSPSAQGEYGLLFAQGQGVSLDYVQAYAWMELSASAGDLESSENRDHLLTLLSASQKEAARKLAADYMRRYPPKK